MTKGDEVGTHGIVYGLCKPDLSVSARIERCNGCNSVNFCISELQESVASACQVPHASISEVIVNDAFQIIKNASCKLELYRGHSPCHQPTSTFGENYQRHGKEVP